MSLTGLPQAFKDILTLAKQDALEKVRTGKSSDDCAMLHFATTGHAKG